MWRFGELYELKERVKKDTLWIKNNTPILEVYSYNVGNFKILIIIIYRVICNSWLNTSKKDQIYQYKCWNKNCCVSSIIDNLNKVLLCDAALHTNITWLTHHRMLIWWTLPWPNLLYPSTEAKVFTHYIIMESETDIIHTLQSSLTHSTSILH